MTALPLADLIPAAVYALSGRVLVADDLAPPSSDDALDERPQPRPPRAAHRATRLLPVAVSSEGR